MTVLSKVTLRNYRCFNWENPAIIEFGNGFTAFVGPNNSGKSSALRSIYELRHIWSLIFPIVVPSNNFRIQAQPQGIADIAELANDHDPKAFDILIEVAASKFFKPVFEFLAVEMLLQYDIESQSLTVKHVRAVNTDGDVKTFNHDDLTTGQHIHSHSINYKDGSTVDYSELHAFGIELQESRYFPAFRNAINEGAGSYYDIPVGTALVNAWDQWKAGNSRSQKIAISRVEREIASLLGFDSLQINADQSAKTLDVIVNGRPQKLYEVGAGIAQLIIVLAAALVQKPPYILIDEPELSLHPSLQLAFLSTLGSYARKGIIYSTHSIGLARSTAQRIFSVHKIKDGVSSMSPFGERSINFAEWLGELSFSGRSELGYEGLILVEGPSEVLCFQEFLRKFNKDHKFVLMQLGGSSLINAGIAPHLLELSRIIDVSKIHIFIDSEKKSADDPLANDRVGFLSECKALAVNAVASERRATENYFENNGIKKALGEEFQALEHYQKLKDSSKPWHKSSNWKIARETNLEDIKNTDLGKFLSAL